MRKIFILLFLNCLLGVVGFAQGSVVLDLSKGDGTKAFVLPRVATTASIVTPINGMLIYDISSNCIKAYQNNVWSGCLGPTTTPVVTDYLRSALAAGGCTSCATYDAASANTWIQITAAEYAQIDNYLTVNIAACTELIMSSPGTAGDGAGYTWVAYGAYAPSLPPNNYVVGFSTYANNVAVNGAYLKYSTSVNTGYSMGGPGLSIPAAGTNVRIYNIMKKPSAVINASYSTYVAIYTSTLSMNYLSGNANLSRYYSGAGTDATSLPNNQTSNGDLYQVKGTATKGW